MTRTVLWSSLALIMIGFGSGYALREGWPSFVLYHLGGLGAVGLLACASGSLAMRKGYAYWPAWSLAFFLPAFLGVVVAYLVTPGEHEGRPAACGGSVSLALGLIFIAVWAFAMRGRRPTAASV